MKFYSLLKGRGGGFIAYCGFCGRSCWGNTGDSQSAWGGGGGLAGNRLLWSLASGNRYYPWAESIAAPSRVHEVSKRRQCCITRSARNLQTEALSRGARALGRPPVCGVDVSHGSHSEGGLRTLRGLTCECVRRVCVFVSVCVCVCTAVAGGRVCACSGGVVEEMVLWVARGSVGEAATPSPSPTTPAPQPHSAPQLPRSLSERPRWRAAGSGRSVLSSRGAGRG